MVPTRVQAYILSTSKRLATASAEQLDLDRARIRLRVARIPLGNGGLRKAYEQSLKGICVRRAFCRVTVATGTVGREDGGFVKIWTGLGLSDCRGRCKKGNSYSFVP